MREMYPYGKNVHLWEKGTVYNVHLWKKGTLMGQRNIYGRNVPLWKKCTLMEEKYYREMANDR